MSKPVVLGDPGAPGELVSGPFASADGAEEGMPSLTVPAPPGDVVGGAPLTASDVGVVRVAASLFAEVPRLSSPSGFNAFIRGDTFDPAVEFPNFFLPAPYRGLSPEAVPDAVNITQQVRERLEAVMASIFKRLTIPVGDPTQPHGLKMVRYFEFMTEQLRELDPTVKIMPSGGVVRSAIGYVYSEIYEGLLQEPPISAEETMQRLIEDDSNIPGSDIRGVGSDFDFLVICDEEKFPALEKKAGEIISRVRKAFGAEVDVHQEHVVMGRTVFIVEDIKLYEKQTSRSMAQGGAAIDLLAFDLERSVFVEPAGFEEIITDFIWGKYSYVASSTPELVEKPLTTTIRGIRSLVELPFLTLKDERVLKRELERLRDQLREHGIPAGNDFKKALEQFGKTLRNSRFSFAHNRFLRAEEGSLESVVWDICNLIDEELGKTEESTFYEFVDRFPIAQRAHDGSELNGVPPEVLMDEAEFVENYTDNGVLYHGTPSLDNGMAIMRGGLRLSGGRKKQGTAAFGRGGYSTKDRELALGYAKADGIVFDLCYRQGRGVHVLDWKKARTNASFNALVAAIERSGRDVFEVLSREHGIDIIINDYVLIQNLDAVKLPNKLGDMVRAYRSVVEQPAASVEARVSAFRVYKGFYYYALACGEESVFDPGGLDRLHREVAELVLQHAFKEPSLLKIYPWGMSNPIDQQLVERLMGAAADRFKPVLDLRNAEIRCEQWRGCVVEDQPYLGRKKVLSFGKPRLVYRSGEDIYCRSLDHIRNADLRRQFGESHRDWHRQFEALDYKKYDPQAEELVVALLSEKSTREVAAHFLKENPEVRDYLRDRWIKKSDSQGLCSLFPWEISPGSEDVVYLRVLWSDGVEAERKLREWIRNYNKTAPKPISFDNVMDSQSLVPTSLKTSYKRQALELPKILSMVYERDPAAYEATLGDLYRPEKTLPTMVEGDRLVESVRQALQEDPGVDGALADCVQHLGDYSIGKIKPVLLALLKIGGDAANRAAARLIGFRDEELRHVLMDFLGNPCSSTWVLEVVDVPALKSRLCDSIVTQWKTRILPLFDYPFSEDDFGVYESWLFHIPSIEDIDAKFDTLGAEYGDRYPGKGFNRTYVDEQSLKAYAGLWEEADALADDDIRTDFKTWLGFRFARANLDIIEMGLFVRFPRAYIERYPERAPSLLRHVELSVGGSGLLTVGPDRWGSPELGALREDINGVLAKVHGNEEFDSYEIALLRLLVSTHHVELARALIAYAARTGKVDFNAELWTWLKAAGVAGDADVFSLLETEETASLSEWALQSLARREAVFALDHDLAWRSRVRESLFKIGDDEWQYFPWDLGDASKGDVAYLKATYQAFLEDPKQSISMASLTRFMRGCAGHHPQEFFERFSDSPLIFMGMSREVFAEYPDSIIQMALVQARAYPMPALDFIFNLAKHHPGLAAAFLFEESPYDVDTSLCLIDEIGRDQVTQDTRWPAFRNRIRERVAEEIRAANPTGLAGLIQFPWDLSDDADCAVLQSLRGLRPYDRDIREKGSMWHLENVFVFLYLNQPIEYMQHFAPVAVYGHGYEDFASYWHLEPADWASSRAHAVQRAFLKRIKDTDNRTPLSEDEKVQIRFYVRADKVSNIARECLKHDTPVRDEVIRILPEEVNEENFEMMVGLMGQYPSWPQVLREKVIGFSEVDPVLLSRLLASSHSPQDLVFLRRHAGLVDERLAHLRGVLGELLEKESVLAPDPMSPDGTRYIDDYHLLIENTELRGRYEGAMRDFLIAKTSQQVLKTMAQNQVQRPAVMAHVMGPQDKVSPETKLAQNLEEVGVQIDLDRLQDASFFEECRTRLEAYQAGVLSDEGFKSFFKPVTEMSSPESGFSPDAAFALQVAEATPMTASVAI